MRLEGELPKAIGIETVSYSHTTKRYKEKEHYLFNQYTKIDHMRKKLDYSLTRGIRFITEKSVIQI